MAYVGFFLLLVFLRGYDHIASILFFYYFFWSSFIPPCCSTQHHITAGSSDFAFKTNSSSEQKLQHLQLCHVVLRVSPPHHHHNQQCPRPRWLTNSDYSFYLDWFDFFFFVAAADLNFCFTLILLRLVSCLVSRFEAVE